ncbi:glycosyl transferase family 2 [Pelobium manganitolerans]|uniref:Glycosyl transferase family 2 n=1 Tax=Pelobium manganitolerans TaxID=1842495 RepID=A0A419S1S4_9SPHI|nr:glycosyltransferase family 2 protein [Pelobium manganitolerans]RKD12425.1 glycosyl transferase family 2 [Pelobium manganitolerans]
MNKAFSFIIISFNEEIHLPRLLASIATLNARVCLLDSGSTDDTLKIAADYGVETAYHPFENHPKQWDYALKHFKINTPWTIGLDADQIVSPELLELLKDFKDEDFAHVNGIYFNRKNVFKGRWLKYGGYYPFYLLKMFRTGKGSSDTSENMDHRFMVPEPTIIWKNGHIIEENLKENEISFWIAKHNRYSDLVADEEIERMQALRMQSEKPEFFGSPNQRKAWFKKIWWDLPRYWRPFFYFIYRFIFKLGILDGKNGVIFHFLQGFWFRLVVDIKIEEKLKQGGVKHYVHGE